MFAFYAMKTPPIETDASSSSEPKLTAWIRRLVAEVREQVRTSAPTMLSMVIYKFPWLISLRFVGAIGAEELAAAALATTLFNVMGLSLSLGLSSALTTLTGQARGDLRGRLEEKNQNHENGQELCSVLRSTGHESREPMITPVKPFTNSLILKV